MTDPKKPSAPASKPTFPELLSAIHGDAAPDLNFSQPGAALFLAQAILNLGEAKLRDMKPAAFREYARTTLRQLPMAWPAFRMGNPVGMLKAIGMVNSFRADKDKIAVEAPEFYQQEIARLTPISPLLAPQIEANRQKLERLQAEQKTA